jgi:Uma2 family endonuclease
MTTPQVIYKPPKARIPKPRLLTYDDYVRLTPSDNGNYELHNGNIIYMASPTPQHQIFSGNLFTEMNVHVRRQKLGRVITAPMDTVFTIHDTFQPDILFVAQERLGIIGDKKIEGAPDLVVEILSPGNDTKEMAYKKVIYEFSEVREYWLVNLTKKTLTQYENKDGDFHVKHIFQQTDTLTSLVIKDFKADMQDLFDF